VGVVLGSAIQGAGATRQSLRLDAVIVLAVQVPLCLAAYVLGWSASSLWLVVALTYVAFALVYVVSYRRGGFLRHQIE
jgi:Na+-driven multidrug efflux pump